MLTFQYLLSLLQISGSVVMKDGVENVYCRELFCTQGNYSRTQALPEEYYVCPPASNFDCKKVNFRERLVEMVKCPEGRMWTGVDNGTVVVSIGFAKGDRLALRSSLSIPDSWRSDVCSVAGSFGLPRCKNEGEPLAVRVQVVNVGGHWVALKPFQIEESPKPPAKVCWSSSGWTLDCDSDSDLNCFCVMDTVEELLISRNNEKVKVDAVGIRDVVSRKLRPVFEVSECSLKKVDEEWVVISHVDLNGRIVTVRKGEEMIKCIVEKNRICHKQQWSFYSGEVVASFFMNGQLISQCTAYEVVTDSCSQLGYTGRWRKYQCWGIMEHLLVYVASACSLWILSSAITVVWCCSRTMKEVMLVCCMSLRAVGKGAAAAGRFSYRTMRRGVNGVIRRVMQDHDELPVVREAEVRGRNSVKERIKRGIVLTMAASSGLPRARASCSNLELSSFKTECGSKSCMISNSMRLVMPSGVSTMCVKPREEQLSELEFELKTSNFRMECIAFEEYWTADYEAGSCSKFECSGQCPKQEEAWRKLTECGAKEGDYTIKTAAPGCVTNGCWSCATSCMLILPYYKIRKDESAVKVHRCKEWIPAVDVDVVKRENGVVEVSKEELYFNSMSTVGPFKVRWLQMSTTPNYAYSEHFLTSGDRVCMINAAVKGNIDPKKIGYVQCSTKKAAEGLNGKDCLFDTRDISCSTGSKNEVQCTMLKPSWREMCNDKWLPLETGSSILVHERGKIMLNINSFGSMEFGLELAEPMIVDVVAPKASCVIAEAKVEGCYNCVEQARIKIISEARNGKPSVYVKCENGIHPFTFTCGEESAKVNAYLSEIDTNCMAMIGFAKTNFRVKGSLRAQVKLPGLSKSGGSGHVSGPDSELPSWNELKWRIIVPLVGLSAWAGFLYIMVKCGVFALLWKKCCGKPKSRRD